MYLFLIYSFQDKYLGFRLTNIISLIFFYKIKWKVTRFQASLQFREQHVFHFHPLIEFASRRKIAWHRFWVLNVPSTFFSALCHRKLRIDMLVSIYEMYFLYSVVCFQSLDLKIAAVLQMKVLNLNMVTCSLAY